MIITFRKNTPQSEIEKIIAELLEQGNAGELLTHEFKEWT